MNNKYKINTHWSLNGNRLVYDVIMDLFSELNKSLKTPFMQQSKSNEEVRKILDNPEGITIEELQVIDAWSLTDKKLRREVRNKLDWAYRELSTRLNRLIVHRNGIPNRSQEKNNNIDNKNKELKNTIISQCGMIESLVKDHEEKENLNEDKSKRKLLVYIRKVYSRALIETIENLFSMATEDTERAKIFPFKEQELLKNKLTALQEKIWSITEKEKQKKTEQKKELEKKLSSLNTLKDALNSSFPNLIDNENKINETVWKETAESLTRLKKNQQQLDKESQIGGATIEKLNNLVKEIEQKTSQALDWVQVRSYVKEVKDNLKKITAELTKEVDQTQNQVLQLSKAK